MAGPAQSWGDPVLGLRMSASTTSGLAPHGQASPIIIQSGHYEQMNVIIYQYSQQASCQKYFKNKTIIHLTMYYYKLYMTSKGLDQPSLMKKGKKIKCKFEYVHKIVTLSSGYSANN
jgi:hypothetical protein